MIPVLCAVLCVVAGIVLGWIGRGLMYRGPIGFAVVFPTLVQVVARLGRVAVWRLDERGAVRVADVDVDQALDDARRAREGR